MHFSISATLLGLSTLIAANPVPSVLEARQAQTLNAAMLAKGKKYFGTSLTIRNDNTEQGLIRGPEFGSITPENSMKWDAIQPNRNQWNWGGADQIANFATQNGKQMRCHTLVWHSQLPGWVSNSGFNNATLIQVMTTHIQTVMARYRGKCTHWDVVNEALEENGSFRNSVFYRVIGPAFIPIAFRIAAQADPSAQLYYNDYNLEYRGAKHQAAVKIVEMVKAYGVRIDGVGLQGHLVVERTPTQDIPTPSLEVLQGVLEDYTALGVDVAYTEIDIRMNQPFSQQKLQTHAEHFARVTQSCMNVPRCVGLTVWGVSDRYSWVPGTFNGEGAALLWNDNFQKKPAYNAVLQAINNA
ncbi:endo-1,4-beta-xylanase precursor [Ascobolus immersus RN42]|uniref:Beta-xylanase n=1 Tax=Ascobolus immersus RN42 TaxID=1160509 RepID=A0A3N4IAN2_ASCIM|nr:endo-1,4-beta-xylanase precursor [Ascobolus immersus RN42]